VKPEILSVIPHCCPDYDDFPAKNAKALSIDNPLRFYTIGTWDERKNTKAVVEAFLRTGWTVADPVELVVHSAPAQGTAAIMHQHSVDNALKQLYKHYQNLPRISVNTVEKSRSWMRELHRMSDVFVSLSKGEAYCLPAHEAWAYHNKVIAAHPAIVERFDTTYSNFKRVQSRVDEITLMPEYPGYEPGQTWHVPDMRAAVSALKDVFTNWKPQRRENETVHTVAQIGALLALELRDVEDEVQRLAEAW
jgi:hypothetical protein